MHSDTLLELLNNKDNTELFDSNIPGKVDTLTVEATRDSKTAVLVGDFHIDELKALVAFMESKP